MDLGINGKKALVNGGSAGLDRRWRNYFHILDIPKKHYS